MPHHFTVIVNRGSGRAPLAQKIAAVKNFFQTEKIDAEIALVATGGDIRVKAAAAAAAHRHAVVIAGGGDGTTSAVASAIIGTEAALGVLPLGTLNHFAQDIGMPAGIPAALKVIVEGHTRRIDVGEVNGEIFLNNSSIGFYPRLVYARESHQRGGAGKRAALIRAIFHIFKNHPVVKLRIRLDGKEIVRRTSLVFVGNNEYVLEGLQMGRRQGLDSGYLDVGIAHSAGRRELARIFTKALFSKLTAEPYFDEYRLPEIWIDSPKKFLQLALDGETKPMRAPLHYRIRPKSLKVIVPSHA